MECQNTVEKPTLHVHHKAYLKGKEPWDYADEFLIVVCEECHERITENTEIRAIALAQHDPFMELATSISIKYSAGDPDIDDFVVALANMARLRPGLFRAATTAVCGVQVGLWQSFVAGSTGSK